MSKLLKDASMKDIMDELDQREVEHYNVEKDKKAGITTYKMIVEWEDDFANYDDTDTSEPYVEKEAPVVNDRIDGSSVVVDVNEEPKGTTDVGY